MTKITDTNAVTRLPPYDSDSEESTLGALLLNGVLIDQITLSPEDFYFDDNKIIYKAMINLKSSHVVIDTTTVAQELHVMGKLEEAGGKSKLSHLLSTCPTSLNLQWYADIVNRMSTYRKLISVANKINDIGYQASSDLAESLNKSDEMLLSVRKSSGNIIILTPEDVADIAFEHYNDLKNQDGIIPVPSGLIDLDKELGGGFYNGEMTILAGRPGIGKTEFSLTLAESASVKGNVLYCSAEMSVEGIIDRFVAGKLQVPVSELRMGKYTEELFNKITGKPIQQLKDSNLYFFRDMPMTTAKILQAGITMKLRFGLEMIIIDYLGILDDDYGNNGYERVGYISRKTKQIARALEVPVIALHQLHREVEKRENKRPQLSDLRDSGKLEEDADIVLLLYRDSYYADNAVNKETEIIIAKNRQGVSNHFIGACYDEKEHKYKNLIKEEHNYE
jgi:replicative DNA helicase